MVTIERFAAPVTNSIVDSVLELVAENVTSLNMTHPPENHPFFDSYRKALILEVGQYLNMRAPHRIEVYIASNDAGVVGFALCGLPLNGSLKECGIYYVAVEKGYRCQGIMGGMVKAITDRYPHVALSCDVSLVPIYERYGFKCHELRLHQVVMYFGCPVEETPVLSVPDLLQHPDVLEEQNIAAHKFGRQKVDRANKDLERNLKTAKQNAKRFFENRTRGRS
ncbi:GNAT family N-acetyltransferase [Pseudomonas marginalis]|uniref:GNAT family N-acetyltransferase n=1 Tax=Pseudomonas marginalis TaxID=298 RepID=UPI002A362831|nr:GNAT family N-acetyltransferase [Pseudomonas marginalis]WPN21786.1 GNAT family N-acetyltransferase [Pseudomonas marginalis]